MRVFTVMLMFVASLCAQQGADVDAGIEIRRPAGTSERTWVPAVLVAGVGDAARGVADALLAAGFAVVQVDPADGFDGDAAAALLASLRQRVRIAHGAVHAVLVGDAAALAAVRAQRHEFQSVTVAGAGRPEVADLRRLRHRTVRVFEGVDAAAVAGHVTEVAAKRGRAGAAGEVDRMLDSFHDAAAVADERRYFALLPDDAVFLGTDASERWTGAQFREFAAPYFERASAWTYVPLSRHVRLAEQGGVAWFDEVLDNVAYGECRGSGVAVLRDGLWVLAHYNLTVPVPNELMRGVADSIRRFEAGEGR